jgi:serine-type D-Ala-D-Ala carboxypeptidase/endopeptidase
MVGEREEVMDLIDDLAGRAMRSGRRVGLVVGYLAGGEQLITGYGRVGAPGSQAPDARTIFEIGSITKVFTGLLLADLATHGVVGLDDPLARYLPASVTVPASEGREITLADLSSHASGLRRLPKGMLRRWLADRHNPYAGLSVEDIHEGLTRTRLRRRPGDRVRYSNLGVGLLGQALERAAGQPWERLVQERICLPLGMRDTVVTPSEEQAARLAVGHTRRGRPVPRFEVPALAGAGALRSTATDMLRFLGPTSTRPAPPWPPRSSASSGPGTGWAEGCRWGSAGCSSAPPSRPARCCGTTAGPADSAASSASPATAGSPWSCSATPPGRWTGWACGSSGCCRTTPARAGAGGAGSWPHSGARCRWRRALSAAVHPAGGTTAAQPVTKLTA